MTEKSRYGLPYKGSKNAIADWVVSNLPSGNRLVDMFAGGCSITHAAMITGRWNRYLINDINNVPELFLKCIEGKYTADSEKRWISREDFFNSPDDDPYVRLLWSFGNDTKTYMYSKQLEPLKQAAHYAVLMNDPKERYKWHKRFTEILCQLIAGGSGAGADTGNLQRLQSFERLQSIEQLRNCEEIQAICSENRAETSSLDYRQVSLEPGDIVYCDIPYIGTSADYCKNFDHEAFYNWATQQTVPIFISEYTMPDDRFEIVAETERTGHLSATNKSTRRVERIYKPREVYHGNA